MSFYFLLISKHYRAEDKGGLDFFSYAIMMSVAVGGDTDTNACVVGGMVGAIVGVNSIQKDMVGKVLSFDCT